MAALVSVWSKSPSAGLCAVALWLGELPAFLFGTLQVPNSNMSLPNPLLRQTACVKLMRTFRHEKCTGEKILRPEPVAFPAWPPCVHPGHKTSPGKPCGGTNHGSHRCRGQGAADLLGTKFCLPEASSCPATRLLAMFWFLQVLSSVKNPVPVLTAQTETRASKN